MKFGSGTESVWISDLVLPSFPPVAASFDVDALVIGGGISGLTTALLLQRAGVTTAVIEQNRIGSGESCRTSAHLTAYVDAGYARLTADFGTECARAVARSQCDALRLIETLSQEAPCEFERVSGFLYTERTSERDTLKTELDAARAVGLDAHLIDRAPLPFATAGAIEFVDQAQFHPGKYLAGLARLYVSAGGTIAEATHVLGVDEQSHGCYVRTDRSIWHANHVVAVTDAPIAGGTTLDTRLRANRSYVLAARVLDGPDGKVVPHGLFWDTDEPYHYVRACRTPEGPLLIIGGEDHRTGTDAEAEAIQRLEQYARERFAVDAIVRRWSGQIMEPIDGLPYIGQSEEGSRVHLATGYSGNGLTYATIAAQLLSDAVRGIHGPYAAIYAVTRSLPLRQWANYAAQNLPAAWTLVTDVLPPPNTSSVDDLRPGEGRVVRLNGTRVAASRDASGVIHLVSPACTHMGCDIAWNVLEQTWDCPCHGSRFGSDGHVVHGPATPPLEILTAQAGPTPVKRVR